jgi:uncharacterized protein YegL
MKKGCFITAISVFTVLVGVVLYIFQNHFDELIGNPGKKLLASFVKSELEKEMKSVVETPEKAELKKLINNYSENVEALKKAKEEDISKLISTIQAAIADSIIQKSEIENIKKIIETKLK